jgi:ABC-2 type transport system ATP-binding protein
MIAIDHVSKQFGPVAALRDITLHIGRGERVAFVGSNGSGKTTLLRAVLGLLRVSGQVRIGGFDVAESPERALAQVAYVPQIAPPLEAPVREVVRAYAALRGIDVPRIDQQAAPLGLSLASIEDVRFRDLSGGMRQKLLAALALAANADVLICDEPSANLDAAARTALFAALEQRSPTGIVLLCSHRQEELEGFVQRVVELRDGALLRDEPTANKHRPRLQVVP